MTETFVVLEGAAGVGKSTLLAALAEELRDQGESVTTAPEFADAEVGRYLAQTLADYGHERHRERALTLLADTLASLSYQAETNDPTGVSPGRHRPERALAGHRPRLQCAPRRRARGRGDGGDARGVPCGDARRT